ncbi:Nitrate/nitrite response regulator protein narL [Providencia rustigianii]|uniref:Transcriptional regulator, LuxR family n=5 Tax=Providencia rustigianii TaxID=158850 RepID=D1P502_9GAMM|nr:LuxR C-terminal-related transcriptional regulator [Providencia rustigianii]EFB71566.1 transcriptional regulator, LuxR family [Providencia rustigianii DSM 4541]SPY77752.1 Nitrate/nitrite response regulator protein narL [Providencia rustigianii]SUC27269.1 Nitrate/nitrite response regulator protein narL [Providencia rustigianii]SUC35738.1 Nitrate/nitrite response regulator protein narL [Providencia rustigianii]VEB70279.1 Nitrate/nitrite response regulator protein narL [Providencia rustigianii]
MSNHTVMIIDEHPIIRFGLSQLINTATDFHVTDEVCNCKEALNIATTKQPKMILIDTIIHGNKTFETIRLLRKHCTSSYLLVLSLSTMKTDIYSAIDAGAQGYLLKNSELDMLINSMKKAIEGHHVFSEKVYQHLITRHQSKDPLSTLTRRECEILHEMAAGLKNREISQLLFISEETVKVHIRNVLKKLRVRSRLEASLIYMRSK